jgi:gamma-glutamyltranspeptidase / glutathione hydrolase
MLSENGRAVMPFGLVGGHYQAAGHDQAAGHAHFLHLVLDAGMDPQQESEAPRCFAHPNGVLEVERTTPEPVIAEPPLIEVSHIMQAKPRPAGQ